jgi:stage V sporulation protein S
VGAATPAADAVETPPTGKGFDVIEDANQEVVLRVGNSSDVKQLASSISFALQDSRKVTLRGVGAGAVNQMAKACAVARGYVASRGVDLIVRPGFTTVKMRDHNDPTKMVDTTAVIFIVSVD